MKNYAILNNIKIILRIIIYLLILKLSKIKLIIIKKCWELKILKKGKS